jgi:hypothetical protein
VSDTQRLNAALGLPEWRFTDELTPNGNKRAGAMDYLGMGIRWDEKPYEWVEGREQGVERLYLNGPIKRLRSRVTLVPEGEGTHLRHSLEFEARALIWEPVARIELGVKVRRSLDRVYRWIDGHLAGESPMVFPRKIVRLSAEAEARLAAVKPRLVVADGFAPDLVQRLLDWVVFADDRSLARIRPLELADRWGAPRGTVFRLCIHATRRGLFSMGWDIVCPSCRGPKVRLEELARVGQEVHCTSCDVRFDTRAERALELVFAVSPRIRPLDVKMQCIGGPGNTPHVVVQRRLGAGERATIAAALAPGTYRLRGPGVRRAAFITARAAEGAPGRVFARLLGPAIDPEESQASSIVELELTNDDPFERLVLLERVEWHDDAVTVGQALAVADFVESFPGQAPPPSLDLTVGRLAMVLVVLDLARAAAGFDADEATRFGHELRALTAEVARTHGGVLTASDAKAPADASFLSFLDPGDALLAASALLRSAVAFAAVRGLPGLGARAGVDAGACLVFNRDGRSAVRGEACASAVKLAALAAPGEIVLDARLAEEVAAAREKAGLVAVHFEATLDAREPGGPEPPYCDLVRLSTPPPARPGLEETRDELLIDVLDVELGEPVGRGASAVVHLGRHARDGRRFAVKILPAPRPSARARFEREVRALARVTGIPGVVSVRGFGDRDNSYWIVLDLVEGISLEERIEQGPLPLAEAAALAARVARALHAVHERGVVHRDVKPANVLLDRSGIPWLIDFGVARFANEAGAEAPGSVSGTLSYLPPEAFDSPPVHDARSDIYSLGATFFELVAGKPIFEGSTGSELIVRVMSESSPDLGQIVPGVSVGAAAIATCALHKRPAERYRTAAEMAVDLERLAAGELPVFYAASDEPDASTARFRPALMKRAFDAILRRGGKPRQP